MLALPDSATASLAKLGTIGVQPSSQGHGQHGTAATEDEQMLVVGPNLETGDLEGQCPPGVAALRLRSYQSQAKHQRLPEDLGEGCVGAAYPGATTVGDIVTTSPVVRPDSQRD